jgi:hypothetical protein
VDDAAVSPTRGAVHLHEGDLVKRGRDTTKPVTQSERKDIMTSTVARISMFVAALVATAAIGAPSALADPPYNTAPSQSVTPTPLMSRQPRNLPHFDHSVLALHRTTRITGGTAFSWSAAGIGALAAAGACFVVFGVTLDVRRRRRPGVA